MPSISSLSGVEKKVMYRGYRIRLATTGPLSNSEQVRPTRFAATPTARPHGPAPITATSSVTSRHLDDLVAAVVLSPALDVPGGQGPVAGRLRPPPRGRGCRRPRQGL